MRILRSIALHFLLLYLQETIKSANASTSNTIADSYVSVAFFVQIKPKPPKINVKKCIELHIPFGPLIGKLQNGESVTLKDGTVVQPEQVRLPFSVAFIY